MAEINHNIKEYQKIRSYTDLPQDEVELLGSCIKSAFGGAVDEDDAKNHMSGDQILVALHQPHNAPLEAAGFSASSIASPAELFQIEHAPSEPGIYFAAAAVARHHQSTGLYGALNDRRLAFAEKRAVDTVFTRTQNPRVEEGITHAIERLIESKKARAYIIGRTALKGVYGRMLTAERPQSRAVRYDNIDYERGDANLITWRLIR